MLFARQHEGLDTVDVCHKIMNFDRTHFENCLLPALPAIAFP